MPLYKDEQCIDSPVNFGEISCVMQEAAAKGDFPEVLFVEGEEEMLPLRQHSLDCKPSRLKIQAYEDQLSDSSVSKPLLQPSSHTVLTCGSLVLQ